MKKLLPILLMIGFIGCSPGMNSRIEELENQVNDLEYQVSELEDKISDYEDCFDRIKSLADDGMSAADYGGWEEYFMLQNSLADCYSIFDDIESVANY